MEEAELYIKDDRWVIKSEKYLNTFTTRESAVKFAKFYKIKLNEKSQNKFQRRDEL